MRASPSWAATSSRQVHEWTLPELIGFVYSTSMLPARPCFGDRVDAFEADVQERLLGIEPSGVFREEASFAYDPSRLARAGELTARCAGGHFRVVISAVMCGKDGEKSRPFACVWRTCVRVGWGVFDVVGEVEDAVAKLVASETRPDLARLHGW